MIPPPILVALASVAVSLMISGIALVVVRRARVTGWLLVVTGAVALSGALIETADHHRVATVCIYAATFLLLPVALTLYPAPRWRHPVDFIALVVVVAAGLLGVLQWDDDPVLGAMGLVVGVTVLVHTWWKVERGGTAERQALLWMALTIGSAGLLAGLLVFASQAVWLMTFAVALVAVVGPALYVGVARPEVVDVRGLVVRGVVLAVAVVAYIALFAVAASVLEVLSGGPLVVGTLALVGALVAVTFHPLQVLLRGVVDELLFGSRPDPLGAASLVAGRIGTDPIQAVRVIRAGLVLPYAALVIDGRELAADGTVTSHVRRIDLDGTGELVVGLRPGDLGLSKGDEQVLRLMAPLLAQTLRARELAADLLESRGQTIAAIEEERRRLRRDLHDGLGPRLSGIAFTSDAVRNLVRTSPGAAEDLLVTLRAETVTAIEDIRGLVYAMRPPALDELGLVPALRQQALGLRTRDGYPLSVSVVAPEDLPALPAAVEVAAYRIVVEALANVARHTSSPTAAVRIDWATTGLALAVTDQGAPAGPWRPGVGLSSMSERAAELGGTLVAVPGDAGGRVEAFLPLSG